MSERHRVKILVAGASGAGKTRFIQTAVHGEQWLTAEEWQQRKRYVSHDAIRMDAHLGEIIIADNLTIRLVNVPSRKNNLHLEKWQACCQGNLAHIFVVDSTKPDSFADTLYTIEVLQRYSPVPYVIAANKQDLPHALGPEYIRTELKLTPATQIFPCIATKKDSVVGILSTLLATILT